MKPHKRHLPLLFILLASLALNAVLVGGFVLSPTAVQSFPEPPPNHARLKATAEKTSSSERDNATSTGKGAGRAFRAQEWGPFLATGASKREFANRLADEGMPPHLIRGVVAAQLMYEYNQKRAEAHFPSDLSYWRRFSAEPMTRPAVQAVESELHEAMQEALADIPQVPDEINQRRTRLGFGDIPEATIEKIKAITQDYTQLRIELRTRVTSADEARRQQEALRLAYREDLEAATSPDELRSYELRSSETAHRLMTELPDIELTEPEYERLFELYRAAETEALNRANPDESPLTVRFNRKELHRRVLEVLGEERGARFLEKNDSSFRGLQNQPSNAGLDATRLVEVWKQQNAQ